MARSDFPHPFSELARRYRELRKKLPKQISVIAAGHFKDNFRRQGYLELGSVVPWPKRKKKQKGSRRAILVKSGRLRRGIRAEGFNYTYAKVINGVPYAAAHNTGMVINGRANVGQFNRQAHTRRRFQTDEVSAPSAREAKYVKKQTGTSQVKAHTVGAHTRQMNTTLPARPFMITTPDLLEDIELHFFEEIDKIWK